MKALTLTQPWATLVAIGAKKIETRSWKVTPQSLPLRLAIHSSKKFPKEAQFICFNEPFRTLLFDLGFIKLNGYGEINLSFPLGCVLAFCTLVECKPITSPFPVDYPEAAFGDYSPGRFAWVLKDVIRIPNPIPARGSLGLWELGHLSEGVIV